MWPCLYALYRGHETKNRLHFVLRVRQPHIKNQWEDGFFVDQRKGEAHRKNSKHARKDSSWKQPTSILISLKLYLMLL